MSVTTETYSYFLLYRLHLSLFSSTLIFFSSLHFIFLLIFFSYSFFFFLFLFCNLNFSLFLLHSSLYIFFSFSSPSSPFKNLLYFLPHPFISSSFCFLLFLFLFSFSSYLISSIIPRLFSFFTFFSSLVYYPIYFLLPFSSSPPPPVS